MSIQKGTKIVCRFWLVGHMRKLNLPRSEQSSTSLQERSANSRSNLYCVGSNNDRFWFPFAWIQFSDQENVLNVEEIAHIN